VYEFDSGDAKEIWSILDMHMADDDLVPLYSATGSIGMST